jgi:DNA-binding PadR family transcriptional regulator
VGLATFRALGGIAVATISSLLAEHVTLQVRSVDRIFLAAYVPRLQCDGQLVRFLNDRSGGTIPSPAILGRIGRRYVEEVNRFAKANQLPVVRFAKGAVKEDVARPYLRRAEREARTGVVMIGVAQEKAFAWRGWREGGSDEHPHFEFKRQAVFVNHIYWYILDPEWGPSFVKTVAYAPYGVSIYLNGHEWAKRQADKQGLEFKPLDTGFASCQDAHALSDICASLSEREIEAFFDRWIRRLPSPFTDPERARYRYRLSVRQLEASDTRMFDRPRTGHAWFERTIEDQLTLGRPDQVQIVFGRKVTKTTPGRFQTKVITPGVQPIITAYYKHSKVKQYFKEGRALRTETTVNDPNDFGVGRTLNAANWNALTTLGHDINERLLQAQLKACSCAPDPTTLERLVSPSIEDGQPAPALHFGDPRVMALLSSLCSFKHLFEGLTNRTLRPQIAELIPGYSTGQMTYDLRRLRRKGLIRRIPKSQRYQLTDEGRRTAVFYTKTHVRIVNPALAELDPHLPPDIANQSPLARHWRAFEQALDDKIKQAAIAA